MIFEVNQETVKRLSEPTNYFWQFGFSFKQEGSKVVNIQNEYQITTKRGQFKILSGEQFKIVDDWVVTAKQRVNEA